MKCWEPVGQKIHSYRPGCWKKLGKGSSKNLASWNQSPWIRANLDYYLL